ncbi:MAG: oligoendopeptidase F, partial [Nitrospinota bacterium]
WYNQVFQKLSKGQKMGEKKSVKKNPERKDINPDDCWDLCKLFENEDAWEEGLKAYEKLVPKIRSFKNTLQTSPKKLYDCLLFNNQLGILEERLGYWSNLKVSEDSSNSSSQGRFSRFMNVSCKAQAENSFLIPEILSIPDEKMESFLKSEELHDFRIFLKKILRTKPHILSEQEEKLIAMQTEFSQTAQKAFSALSDVDMDFGVVDTPDGKQTLTQSTYGSLILHKEREVRKKAYSQLLQEYKEHEHTLAALYSGSVRHDIFVAKARKYSSSLNSKLFPDMVPEEVYTNLISTVHENLDFLHQYYEVRQKALKLKSLHLYDTRVPIIEEISVRHSYDEAVALLERALLPLGDEYVQTMKAGLLGGWVDRYENKGKRSGAFSAGSFTGDPYILMNFKEDVFNDVFTLAHEAGHSMHSWYSSQNNPFQHYDYTIFAAEVASTFNEQLLAHYLLEHAESKPFRLYLINKQVDDIIGTIFRQTMFAEYEKVVHEMAEENQPLTLDTLKLEYEKLLKIYFGTKVSLEPNSSLEGLRIPHFYHSFYVYKYATGLSAAIALSQKVLHGEGGALERYISFLKSGGSKYPL